MSTRSICWKTVGERLGQLDNVNKSKFFQGLSCAFIKAEDKVNSIHDMADKVAKMPPSDRAIFFNRFAETAYNFCCGDLEIDFLLTGMRIERKYKQTLKRALTCLWIRGE